MNKIKTIMFGIALTMLVTISVHAQTSALCPTIYLPYNFEFIYSSGINAGQIAYETEGARSISEVENFYGYVASGHVDRWDGSTPIQINYTIPLMSQSSSIWRGCVNQDDLNACITSDFAEWISICPGMFTVTQVSSLAPGSPGINMGWSNTGTGFDAGQDANGVVTIAGGLTDMGQATDDLGIIQPQIHLNNGSTFNGQLLYTTCPMHCTIPTGYNAISICEVLLHEIGHAFGLLDLYDDPSCCGQNYPQAVMWGELQAVAAGPTGPCPDKTIQDVDHCYFCKLYCPAQCATLSAPLPSGDTSMSISVFPNPATLSFTVTYKSLEPYSSLSIEDIMGREILRQYLKESEGTILETSAKIPPGAYIIRLQGSEHFIAKMLIIQ